MNLLKLIVILSFGCSVLFSCNDSNKLSAEEYTKWLGKNSHLFTQEKEISGYKIKLKYIPCDYLILKELNSNKKINRDSIEQYYRNNLTFVLSIAPVENKEGRNIMFDQVTKFEEYKKRVFELNFNMEEMVELKVDDNETLLPSIYNVENTYGLSKDLNFNIVFSPKDPKLGFKNLKNIDFVLNDYIFETGINHFVFNKKELENLPSLL